MTRRVKQQQHKAAQIRTENQKSETDGFAGLALAAKCAIVVAVIGTLWAQWSSLAPQMPAKDDLRSMVIANQWSKVAKEAAKMEAIDGLVQVAVANRAYRSLKMNGPLKELCTGCIYAEKEASGVFRNALVALASKSSVDDLRVALFAALRARDLTAVKVILDAGAPPSGTFNAKDPTTPLHLAVSTSSEVAVLSKALLKQGEIPKELADWMLSNGGSGQIQNSSVVVYTKHILPIVNQWTSRFVNLLVRAGADIFAKDILSTSPLHVAAAVGNTIAIQEMLSGTDMSDQKEQLQAVVDAMGHTPVDTAVSHGFDDTAAVLLGFGLERTIGSLREPSQESNEATKFSNGGWSEEPVDPKISGLRKIDVRMNLTKEAMFVDFFVARRPVLIKEAALHWELRKMCSNKLFMKKFGRVKLASSVIPYGDQYGYSKTGIKIKDFLKTKSDCKSIDVCNSPQYMFERDVSDTMPDFVAKVPTMPESFPNGRGTMVNVKKPQFYLGPAGSGAPMHFHGDAWNGLMYGKKHWIILPPNKAVFSRLPISKLLANISAVKEMGGLHAVQGPGDVIFVPKGWSHGVFNEQLSIGVAREIESVFSRY